jgi:hypothetical protein
MATANLEQAVAGLMQVEQRILAIAAERGVHGFKIEWNQGLDFGHLMDPVPVALLTDGGRVEGQFPLQDLAAVRRAEPNAIAVQIEELVRQLADMPHKGPPAHEPPGSP